MRTKRIARWRHWLRCKRLTQLGSVLFGAGLCAALLTWSDGASAYRTAASDPQFQGTEQVRWSTDQIAYRLNTDTPSELGLAEVEAAVVDSLSEWAGPACSRVRFAYEGNTSLPAVRGDGANTIQWIRQGWTARGYDPTAAAITEVQYQKAPNGQWQIVEADLYLNGESHRWVTGGVPTDNERRVQSVLVHEAGHMLGLYHPCEMAGAEDAPDCATDPSYALSALYPIYSPGGPVLSTDDTAGVCFLYPGLRCEVEGCPRGATCRAEGCVMECGGTVCALGEQCIDQQCVVAVLAAASAESVTDADGGARVPYADEHFGARGTAASDATARGCSRDSDCPDGVCVKNSAAVGLCMARQPFGAACSSANECLGGQCLAKDSERGVCTGACADGGTERCPLGWMCEPVEGTPVCRPPELGGGGSGVCSLSPIAPRRPTPFGLAAAGLLAWISTAPN